MTYFEGRRERRRNLFLKEDKGKKEEGPDKGGKGITSSSKRKERKKLAAIIGCQMSNKNISLKYLLSICYVPHFQTPGESRGTNYCFVL